MLLNRAHWFEKFQEAGKSQMATVSVESFFILEICCNNKILFKQDCFDQLEKFQEQKGKSQRVTIAQESFFMFETCPYHKEILLK